jgi:hypothetical protein
MSNPAMPGLYKIGFTSRAAEERLQEANQPNTWVPMPFSYEFYKFVANPQAKEGVLHRILAKDRVNPNREFFRVDVEYVKLLFDLMDTVQAPEPDTTDVDTRMVGDEVLRLFLDTFIYPPEEEMLESIHWTKIAAYFQTWKRESGYTAGNTTKLRELLIEAYGDPRRGEWTNFRMKM